MNLEHLNDLKQLEIDQKENDILHQEKINQVNLEREIQKRKNMKKIEIEKENLRHNEEIKN
jgi:hypothetical protein